MRWLVFVRTNQSKWNNDSTAMYIWHRKRKRNEDDVVAMHEVERRPRPALLSRAKDVFLDSVVCPKSSFGCSYVANTRSACCERDMLCVACFETTFPSSTRGCCGFVRNSSLTEHPSPPLFSSFFSFYQRDSRLKKRSERSGRWPRSSARTGRCRSGSGCAPTTKSNGTPSAGTGAGPNWDSKNTREPNNANVRLGSLFQPIDNTTIRIKQRTHLQ